MRKTTVGWMVCLAALGFAATVLLAQSQSRKPTTDAAKAASAQLTPLNMKTGVWQTTMTGKYSGLPPQMAAAINPTPHAYKSCVKPEQLSKDQWAKGLAGYKCSSMTVLKSTGTDVDVQATGCDVSNGMTAGGHGKFHMVDSGHLTGSMDVTFSGNTPFGDSGSVHMHADYTSNWIGASCPADMN
jgi:uncharacterized protein DUF3617